MAAPARNGGVPAMSAMVEIDRMLGCLFVRQDADPRAILAQAGLLPE